jgi:hypothetical protein
MMNSYSLLLLSLLVLSFVSFVSAGTNEAGLAFLEENKQKPGVVTLPSGLQYKILTKGRYEKKEKNC